MEIDGFGVTPLLKELTLLRLPERDTAGAPAFPNTRSLEACLPTPLGAAEKLIFESNKDFRLTVFALEGSSSLVGLGSLKGESVSRIKPESSSSNSGSSQGSMLHSSCTRQRVATRGGNSL